MKNRKAHKRLIWVVILIIAIIVVIYFVVSAKDAPLPESFYDARKRAAEAGQQIVDLTQKTNSAIKDVNVSDFDGDVNRAISLIQEARETNTSAYKKAGELSRFLEELTRSLSEIRSRESQRVAYQAVAIELSLVAEFIVYTQNLNGFFDALSKAVASNAFADRRAVELRLEEVNAQAKKINEINRNFLEKIGEFDRML